MKTYIYSIIIGLIFTSCAIQQDYYFEKNGEVKMDISVDMSALFTSLPAGGDNKDFGNIKDSINAQNDIKDSMEHYGITQFDIDFDTTSYKLTSAITFKNIDYFEKFMNKDRDENLKPIKVEFSSSTFSVKNCASLISTEMLKGLGETQKESNDSGMDMSSFFTFKTTYHFPYKVKNFTSASGKGKLDENKKSISFDNTLSEFTDDNYSGDLQVNF